MPAKHHHKLMNRTIVIFSILITYVILCQCCMKFRINDGKAIKKFAQKNLTLQVFDTLFNQQNIHYVLSGNDSLPLLVFIHGSPGSWSTYKDFMLNESISKKFRCLSIDRPGFGYSNFGTPMHLEEQSELFLRIVAAHQNDKPIYLVGHSIGGPVVAQMAALSPGSFKKIVIMSGSISPYLEKKENWRRIFNNPVMRNFLPGAFAPSSTEILWFKKDLYGLEKQMHNINTNVIFLHGDKDKWVPIGNVKYGIEKMENARSTVTDTIHGAGHMIQLSDKDRIIKLLTGLY